MARGIVAYQDYSMSLKDEYIQKDTDILGINSIFEKLSKKQFPLNIIIFYNMKYIYIYCTLYFVFT